MKLQALPALALCAALISHAFAGPLKEAKINQIVNDVKLVEPRQGARPAAVQDVVKDDLGVATGVQSRAELLFQDDTLTRLGAETFFSFQPGTRDLKLDRGSMLLQVPKNLGGARIRAASVTASITGTTIMMENLPGKAVKIVVLEGSLNVAVTGRPADRIDLRAGKMIIVTPEAKKLPQPVDVDLRKMVRTSALIDPVAFRGSSKAAIAALPSMGLIEKEMVSQETRLKADGVTASTFTISGDAVAAAAAAEPKLATTKPDAQPTGANPEATAPQTERETAVAILKEEVVQVISTNPTPGSATTGSVLDKAVAADLLVAGDIQINAGPDPTASGVNTN
ncbi:MAG: FecR domain-containing protein, partial [Chthoniobacteraceae bacterium]